MTDRPDAIQLLTLARTALLDALVPVLPADAQYPARMVANAIAVALRELDSAGADATTLRMELAPLFEPAAATLPTDALERRLVEEIRSGARDDDPATRAHIVAAARRRTRVWNPRALPG